MKRKRWKARLVGGLLVFTGLAGGSGCKHQLFMEPADHARAAANLPFAKLESQPHDPIIPGSVSAGPPPTTVLDSCRPPQPITRMQAIAIALERGTEGGGLLGAGQSNDRLPQSNGRGGRSSGTDAIRAFAMNPAADAAEVERALSKFDARWINSITWNKVDQPTLSLQQSFSNGDRANLTSTLAKPLPTGGIAGITFQTDYLNLSTPPSDPRFVSLTTSYTPQLQFVLEQPLLQGFGVEINQLLPRHPGGFLIPGLQPSGGASEGILVTNIRVAQSRAQFDNVINNMLLNVESAYWNLFSAYYNLASQEEGYKNAIDNYAFISERAGKLAREEEKYLAEAQVHQFRAQVIEGRQRVFTTERALRNLLGMPATDGTRLIPIDEPTLVPLTPDYHTVANEALQFSPGLVIARQEVKARQLNLMLNRNLRRPDLRLLTSYNVAGLGARLDGRTEQENALRALAANNFNSWQIGLRLDFPIGFRDANAVVRQSRIELDQSMIDLIEAERKATSFMAQQVREVVSTHQFVLYRRAQRQSLERYIDLNRQGRLQGAVQGANFQAFVANLLSAQQQLANATAAEYQAIADYNIALATLEWAKGTIQQYNNVTVADGPLPDFVQKKAEDHFRASEAALKLREHPADMPLAPLHEWKPLADIALPPLPGTGTLPPPPAPLTPTAPAPRTLPPEMPPPATLPPSPPKSAGTIQPMPGGARNQLIPADAPAPAFTPQGTVSTQRRGTSTASTPTPEPAPAPPPTPIGPTPVAIPLPPSSPK
jgi:outer membrane protein TolC